MHLRPRLISIVYLVNLPLSTEARFTDAATVRVFVSVKDASTRLPVTKDPVMKLN